MKHYKTENKAWQKCIAFMQKCLHMPENIVSVFFSPKNAVRYNDNTVEQYGESKKEENDLNKKYNVRSSNEIAPAYEGHLTEDQEKALKAMLNGQDIFISGGAGVGKTYLLKQFVKKCSKKNILICAPTGVAAYNAGGVTCHSLFGIEVKNNDIYTMEDIHQIYNYISNYKLDAKDKAVTNFSEKRILALFHADIIIIDEISMCRGDLFEMIMAAIKGIQDNKTHNKSRPQLIVLGDFFQLPPVLLTKKDFKIRNGNESYSISQQDRYYEVYNNRSGFAFFSDKWHFNLYSLTTVMRQENRDFVDALNKLRLGSEEGKKYIIEHSHPTIINDALWLCGSNKNAENRNLKAMEKIDGKEYIFNVKINKLSDEIENKEIDDEVISAVKSRFLKLKIGCRVVALVNNYNEKGEIIYANGSRGVVKSVDDKNDLVTVDFENGNTCKLPLCTWEIKRYLYDKIKGKLECKIMATFYQIPLVLGYAATVHKSQGQTLNAINVDNDCNFAHGQMYVALSRAKDVGNIYIEDKKFEIKCSEEVKNFYSNN